MSMKKMKRLITKRPESFVVSFEKADVCISSIRSELLVNGYDLYVKNVEDQLLINNNRFSEHYIKLCDGDVIRIGNTNITILVDKIIIDSEDGEITTNLRVLDLSDMPFDGFPDYSRSPRIIKKIDMTNIKLSLPKPLSEKRKGELLQTLLPPLGMLLVTVAVSILLRRGLFVLMSIAGTGMTVIIAILRFITGRRDLKEDKVSRTETYEKYLLRKRKEIFALYTAEKEADDYNYPDLKHIERMINKYDSRIYERSPMDDDYLRVVVGHNRFRSSIVVSVDDDELNDKKDPLIEEAKALVNEYSYIDKPVVIDLKKAHLGIVGEKEVIHEQLNVMFANLTFFYSYHDLEIVFIYNSSYDEEFSWLRWYPQLKIHALNCSGVINSERKRDQILGSLHQILKDRKLKEEESKKDSMFLPHFLFVIDEPKWVIDHSIMEYLGKDGYNIGFTIIYTTNMRANLPENIGTVIELKSSNDAGLVIEEKEERNIDFRLQRVGDVDLEWMSRNLSVLNHQQGVSARIPESISFFRMYGVDKPSQLNIANRWMVNDSSKSLAVPIGARADSDYVYLNLHEKAHGPHGLVAGTTGSGKSEILQTFILSLAVNFSPYEVAFLLIDYKGGGMASLFEKLPHLLGTITNLDGSQSMRAMSSIKAELSRRQSIFNDYHVNHINSYNKLFKLGEAKEPLPHLFIISDEFAELKKEQPDFMKELVSAARIGRSLGVHLILATQKPTGVVDDQIWSNSKFKLALKVQNESDSKEILKTADAANIVQTGRAYLQVGNNEIYELFQSAWSGAAYDEDKQTEKKDDRVYLINELGQKELVNRDLSDHSDKNTLQKTQLDVTVDYIRDYYDSIDAIELTKPWLPPLAERIVSPVKDITPDGISTIIKVGVVDVPERQIQTDYSIDLGNDGNLLYVATAGFGKTVFLTTCALSLAMCNSVELMNMYVLDFGNSGLVQLNSLHHTADYITYDDQERLGKFINIINREITDRKNRLAKQSVQNIHVYNRVSADKMKAIVILIDNMDVIKELGYDAEEFFQRVLRDGTNIGLYVLGTASRSSGIKYSLFGNFRNKICGFVSDGSDVSTVVGRTPYKTVEVKGRCLVKYEDAICYMQIYTMTECDNEIDYNDGIKRIINKINSIYPGVTAPRIPVLPDELDCKGLLQYVTNKNPKGHIFIGLDHEWVQPAEIKVNESPFLIIGESRRGKTNVIRVILDQIVGTGEIYLCDSNAMDLYNYKNNTAINFITGDVSMFVQDMEKVNTDRTDQMNKLLLVNSGTSPKELIMQLPRVFVVIDDIDDFIGSFDSVTNTKIGNILSESVNLGVMLIITANSGKFKGFDAISKFIKNTTYGLMVGSQGTNTIFPISSTKDVPKFKDGLLWRNGMNTRIRIPQCL